MSGDKGGAFRQRLRDNAADIAAGTVRAFSPRSFADLLDDSRTLFARLNFESRSGCHVFPENQIAGMASKCIEMPLYERTCVCRKSLYSVADIAC